MIFDCPVIVPEESKTFFIMSDGKTIIYTPESGGNGGNGMLGMLAPLLQKNGLDPNLLLAMNSRNNGMGGDGSWFMWIIFLFFLFPLFGRNGWGGNGNNGGNGGGFSGIPNLINNDSSRELLMQAIEGNGQAINSLATNLNCSVGQIQQAINSLTTQVSNIGCQVGMSTQQIINSIQAGNTQIAQQLADCCCENRLAICNQTNTLQNTMNQNTLQLRDSNAAGFQAILSKLDAAETRVLQDKLDAERARSAALTTQLSQEHQTSQFGQMIGQATAPLGAALGDLSSRLAKIECKQPETVSIPYIPAMGSFLPVNYGINVNPYSTLCGC